MSTARKILWNTVSQTVGKFIVTLLGLVTLKIITNYLGVTGYGEYTTVYQFLAFFGIAADLGLFTIAVREMSRDENRIPIIAGNVLGLRTALITITMILAIVGAFLIPQYQSTRIPIGVAIATITIWLAMVQGTLCTVLQVHLKMEYSSYALIASKIVNVAYMIFVIYLLLPLENGTTACTDAGFYQLIFAGIPGNLVLIIVTYYYARKLAPIRYQFNFALWKETLWKSLPYGIALILNTFYFRIDSLLLYFIRGPVETGVYGVPMKLFEQIMLLPLYFMNAVLPVLTKAIDKGRDAYNRIIQYAYDFIIMISFPILAGGYALAYPLIFVISGPEFLSKLDKGFYGSDIALKILLFSYVLSFIAGVFTFVLIAVGKQLKILWVNLAGAIFNVIANLIIIPIYGFRGAAIISVATQVMLLIMLIFYSRKCLSYSLKFSVTLKSAFASIIMGVSVYLLYKPFYNIMENWSVVALVIIAAIIYFGILLITKAVTRDMINMLRRPEKETEVIEQIGDGSGTV